LVKESVENTSLDNYGRSNKDNVVISNVKSYRVGLKPAYTIIEVRDGSPAQKAGLLKDDIIVSINGKQAHTLKLQEITYFFRDRIGKTVRLKVERGNTILNKVFQLEDVFKKKELSN
jgi:C-terminal processing protease CtpA/Prc